MLPVIFAGVVVSLFLIFIARPAGVFVSLALGRSTIKEKTFISWVGLRGAVPIVLATFPLLAGVPESHVLFNLVFFIVITSVLLQGTSIPFVARWLGVDAPGHKPQARKVEFEFPYEDRMAKAEIDIPHESQAVGKQIVELGLPVTTIIMLIKRGDRSIVPRGATVLEPGDRLLVMTERDDLGAVRSILSISK